MSRMLSKMNLISVVQQLPKEDIETIQGYVEMIEQECEELKKQLTTYQILHRDCKVDNLKNISKIEEMENKQKEFIAYLTHELNTSYTNSSRYYYFSLILSKYKSIIGE